MNRLFAAAFVTAGSLAINAAHAWERHTQPAALVIKAQHNHGGQPAGSGALNVGSLVIEAPWTRATPAGAKVAGGYVTISNTGTTPDRLIGGSFPMAGRFEVHDMAVTNGVMTMRELATGLEIAPGQKLELKPGGRHLMFIDLKNQIKEGQPITGTLVFEKAGTVEVVYRVAPIGARAPAGAHAH